VTTPALADHAATIRACFEAYRTKDRAAIEALLAPDLRFTSPYDDAIDRKTYFERCWPNSARFIEHVVERIVADGDDAAFVTYLARVEGGAAFRNTEYMTFDAEGRIRTVHVYFGESYRDGTFTAQKPG
jgi:ketosteroid isomerase-like protein